MAQATATGDGPGEPPAAAPTTNAPLASTNPEPDASGAWEPRWREIRRHAAASDDGSGAIVAELLVHLGHPDPLLAYAACQALRERLDRRCDASDLTWVLEGLVSAASRPPPEGDTGVRFQFLRWLIKSSKKAPHDDDESDDDDDGDDDGDDDADTLDTAMVRAPRTLPLSQKEAIGGILSRLDALRPQFLAGVEGAQRHPASTHEVLLLLSELYKRMKPVDHEDHRLDALDSLTMTVYERVASTWDWVTVPTYLMCDLLDLLLHWRHAADGERLTTWRTTAMAFVAPTGSLTAFVLRLLHASSRDDDQSLANAAATFTAADGPYPLVQKWLHAICVVLLAELDGRGSQPISPSTQWPSTLDLPTRASVLRALAEQDDTLVDVLDHLQQIHSRITDPRLRDLLPASWQCHLTQFIDEFRPDALFAELLLGLGDDHLVVLDMLMSSETGFLVYLMRVLRRVTDSDWPATRACWHRMGRLVGCMAVLIRLRLEIERLVRNNVFPYNPRPLLRRLEQLEELYEGSMD